MSEIINELIVKDVRFPTSLTGDGSDAMVSIIIIIFKFTNKQTKMKNKQTVSTVRTILFTC